MTTKAQLRLELKPKTTELNHSQSRVKKTRDKNGFQKQTKLINKDLLAIKH